VRGGSLIGIIADTHDNRNKTQKAVQVFNEREVALVIHAGDFVSPFNSRDFSGLNAEFIGVFGNNDGDRLLLTEKFAGIGKIFVGVHEFDHSGKCFALMHQPALIEALSLSDRFDVIVYGHTHRVDVRKGSTLVVNPGECGGWVYGRSTIAILDLEKMEAEIVDL